MVFDRAVGLGHHVAGFVGRDRLNTKGGAVSDLFLAGEVALRIVVVADEVDPLPFFLNPVLITGDLEGALNLSTPQQLPFERTAAVSQVVVAPEVVVLRRIHAVRIADLTIQLVVLNRPGPSRGQLDPLTLTARSHTRAVEAVQVPGDRLFCVADESPRSAERTPASVRVTDIAVAGDVVVCDPVAIFVCAIAGFGGCVPADPAGVQNAFVDDAVAVIIDAVADLVNGSAGLHAAGDTTVAVAPIEGACAIARPDTHFAGGVKAETFVDTAVTVVVDVVAQLVHGAGCPDALAAPLSALARFRADGAGTGFDAALTSRPVHADVAIDALGPGTPVATLAGALPRAVLVDPAGVVHLAVAVAAHVGVDARRILFPRAVDAGAHLGADEVEPAVAGFLVAVVAVVRVGAGLPGAPAPAIAVAVAGADAVEATGAEISLAVFAGRTFDTGVEGQGPVTLRADHQLQAVVPAGLLSGVSVAADIRVSAEVPDVPPALVAGAVLGAVAVEAAGAVLAGVVHADIRVDARVPHVRPVAIRAGAAFRPAVIATAGLLLGFTQLALGFSEAFAPVTPASAHAGALAGSAVGAPAGLLHHFFVGAYVGVDACRRIAPLPVKAEGDLAPAAVAAAGLLLEIVVGAHVGIEAGPGGPASIRAQASFVPTAVDAAGTLLLGTLLAEGTLDALAPVLPESVRADALTVGVHGVYTGLLFHVAVPTDVGVYTGFPAHVPAVGAPVELTSAAVDAAKPVHLGAVFADVGVDARVPDVRPLALGAGARLVSTAVEAAVTVLDRVVDAGVGIIASPGGPGSVCADTRLIPTVVETAGARLLGAFGDTLARRRGSHVGQIAVGVDHRVGRSVSAGAHVGHIAVGVHHRVGRGVGGGAHVGQVAVGVDYRVDHRIGVGAHVGRRVVLRTLIGCGVGGAHVGQVGVVGVGIGRHQRLVRFGERRLAAARQGHQAKPDAQNTILHGSSLGAPPLARVVILVQYRNRTLYEYHE